MAALYVALCSAVLLLAGLYGPQVVHLGYGDGWRDVAPQATLLFLDHWPWLLAVEMAFGIGLVVVGSRHRPRSRTVGSALLALQLLTVQAACFMVFADRYSGIVSLSGQRWAFGGIVRDSIICIAFDATLVLVYRGLPFRSRSKDPT